MSTLATPSAAIADSGAPTWNLAAQYPTSYRFLHVDCPSPDICFATGSGLYKSTDGGLDWFTQPAQGYTGDISCPTVESCFVANGGSIGQTSNGGKSWIEDSMPQAPDSFTNYGCGADGDCLRAISCADSEDCIAVGNYDLESFTVSTNDGGLTWTQEPLPGNLYEADDISCPTAADCFVVGEPEPYQPSLVLVTNNFGSTWTVEDAPTASTSTTFNQITCPSTSMCVAVGGDDIVTTVDGGLTWVDDLPPPRLAGTYDTVSCTQSLFCMVGGMTGAGSSLVLTAATATSSWSAASPPPMPSYWPPSTSSCQESERCVIADSQQMDATRDGGSTWLSPSYPEELTAIGPLSCSNASDCIAITDDSFDSPDGEITTVNGGRDWTTDPEPTASAFLQQVQCLSDLDCYLLLTNTNEYDLESLYVTTDYGRQWTRQSSFPPGVYISTFSCSTGGNCVAIGAYGESTVVYTSADSGAIWQPATSPRGTDYLNILDCPSQGTCFASGALESNETVTMFKSTDGGLTWVSESLPEIQNFTYIHSISCVSKSHCVAVGGNGATGGVAIWTADGGTTWTQGSFPAVSQEPDAVSCTSASDCVTVVAGYGPITSVDGGATWEASPDENQFELETLACASPFHCFAGGWSYFNSQVATVAQTMIAGPQIELGGLPSGNLGQPYTGELQDAGGVAPVTWSITQGALPSGLSLDPQTGDVEGTPTAVGTFDFRAEVTDADGDAASTEISLVVSGSSVLTATLPLAPVSYGSMQQYSATVAADGVIPTGTVTLLSGQVSLCRASLVSGTATCSSSLAPVGDDQISIEYSGDLYYAPAEISAPLEVSRGTPLISQNVAGILRYGETAQFDAVVSGSGVIPTGSVEFEIGERALCTGTVVYGSAGCTAPLPVTGSVAISSSYSGDQNYLPVSTVTEVTIGRASTSTVVSANPSIATAGTPLKLIGSVISGVGAPTGTMEFLNGSTVLCTSNLVGGTGSCTITTLPSGKEVISAAFEGDSDFAPSAGTTVVDVTSSPGCSSTGQGSTNTLAAYWMLDSSGAVYSCGDARSLGGMSGLVGPNAAVAIASTPDAQGYWIAGADGAVYAFGNAKFYGSMGGRQLGAPITGIASTADGRGYWLVGADGGIFAFGDASFFGSMGGHQLAAPIVAMAVDSSAAGYWLVGADGGVFGFGNAAFFGSMSGEELDGSVTGMAATSDGQGYWLATSGGGVYSFGDADYQGSVAIGPNGGSISSIANAS